MGLRWWLGALCVRILSTRWGGDTVLEKEIHSIELRSLEIMDVTGLSLLSNGWHESLPAKCADHGGKRGEDPAVSAFAKDVPAANTDARRNTDSGEVCWESKLLQRTPSRIPSAEQNDFRPLRLRLRLLFLFPRRYE